MAYTLTCETCGHVYDMEHKPESSGDWIKPHILRVKCNWCPKCEDRGEGYWEEFLDENDDQEPLPAPVPDNQLTMPFLFDELGIPKPVTVQP